MTEPKMISVRIPGTLRERIDTARGDVPRERWIRRALEHALTTHADPRGTDRASRALPAGDRADAFRGATQRTP